MEKGRVQEEQHRLPRARDVHMPPSPLLLPLLLLRLAALAVLEGESEGEGVVGAGGELHLALPPPLLLAMYHQQQGQGGEGGHASMHDPDNAVRPLRGRRGLGRVEEEEDRDCVVGECPPTHPASKRRRRPLPAARGEEQQREGREQ